MNNNCLNEEFFSCNVNTREIYGMVHKASCPKAIVVVAHGLNGERIDAHRILIFLSRCCNDDNIAVFRFDFSGCGVTEYEFFQSSVKQRVMEYSNIVKFAQNMYPKVPLFCLGFSDGCRIVYDCIRFFKPAGCIFWSPVILPALAEDADLSKEYWTNINDSKYPVKPFLGLWLGFKYVCESYKVKKAEIENIPIIIIRGALDHTINNSINFLRTEGDIKLIEIEECGHIFESRNGTKQVIKETVRYINKILEDKQ